MDKLLSPMRCSAGRGLDLKFLPADRRMCDSCFFAQAHRSGMALRSIIQRAVFGTLPLIARRPLQET